MIQAKTEKLFQMIAPISLAASATAAETAIDTEGWGFLTAYFLLGVTDCAMTALKLTESDVSGSGYTDIPNEDYTVSPAVLPTATDDGNIFGFQVDLLGGRKRYIKAVITAGTGTSALIALLGILSRPQIFPSTLAMRGLTGDIGP